MNVSEWELRQQMAELCALLFARRYSVGTAGNVSARLPDGILMTPTKPPKRSFSTESITKQEGMLELLSTSITNLQRRSHAWQMSTPTTVFHRSRPMS